MRTLKTLRSQGCPLGAGWPRLSLLAEALADRGDSHPDLVLELRPVTQKPLPVQKPSSSGSPAPTPTEQREPPPLLPLKG